MWMLTAMSIWTMSTQQWYPVHSPAAVPSDSSFFSDGRYDLNFDLIADYARIHNVQLGNIQLG